MAKVRVKKNGNYTVMSNYHLRDNRLSLKAMGLMSWMLSCPENWDYSISGSNAVLKDGKSAIRSAIAELEELGYLERTMTRGEDGKFSGYDYVLHEQPSSENPTTVNPTTVNPMSENCTQITTNKITTNKKKEAKKKTSSYMDVLNSVNNIELKEALLEFIKMRKMLKKPLTDKALQLAIKKLIKITNDENEQIQIVNTTIEHSWLSFYPLKKDETTKETHNYSTNVKKVNSFNNFHQRDYSQDEMDELEKRLLNK